MLNLFKGDLDREEEVLKWLITQRTQDTIEEVTDEMLTQLIATSHYVAVYFSKYPLKYLNRVKFVNVH